MASTGDVEVTLGSDPEPSRIMLVRRDSHANLTKSKFKKKVEEIKTIKRSASVGSLHTVYKVTDEHKHHHPWTFTSWAPSRDMHVSDKIYHFLHCKSVHIVFSALLLIDIMIVIISISLELEYLHSKVSDYEDVVDHCQSALEDGGDHALCEGEELGEEKLIEVVETLAIASLSILALFLLESLLLLAAKPRHFFSSPMYSIDLLVVTVSIVLEVLFQNEPQGGLLVVARVWRFARIGHGVFENSKPDEEQIALVETLRGIDKDHVISDAFLANEKENPTPESTQYKLEYSLVTEIIAAVGAYLTFHSE